MKLIKVVLVILAVVLVAAAVSGLFYGTIAYIVGSMIGVI